MWVQSLGQEDPLERKSLQPTPAFLPGNPIDRGVWQVIVHGVTKDLRHDLATEQQ